MKSRVSISKFQVKINTYLTLDLSINQHNIILNHNYPTNNNYKLLEFSNLFNKMSRRAVTVIMLLTKCSKISIDKIYLFLKRIFTGIIVPLIKEGLKIGLQILYNRRLSRKSELVINKSLNAQINQLPAHLLKSL